MQKMAIALILVILGLIVIAFPFLGVIPIAVLSGFLVLMLGFGLILTGIYKIGENDPSVGILMLILGIIALILGIGLSFNPALFTWLVGFVAGLMGLFLIIEGISRILSRTKDICGVKNIIIGILIIIVGLFFTTYTWLIVILIGLWLLSTGIRMIYLRKKNRI
jgi:membrane protein HdeD